MFWSHHFAEVSKLAYLDNEKKKFKELGYTFSQFYDVDGAQAYVLWSKDFITIAFRGTEPDEFNDIKADLRATKHNGYHEGFYIEYMKLHDKIKAKVDDLQSRKDRPLYICGHSLGGAMATVCASHYNSYADELYTYGSPRALSRQRCKELQVPHKRHVNNNDIVPKVPPALLMFKHHGQLCYLNHYGNIRNMSWWQRFKDGWRGRLAAWKNKQPFDGLRDHSIDNYAKYLSDGE